MTPVAASRRRAVHRLLGVLVLLVLLAHGARGLVRRPPAPHTPPPPLAVDVTADGVERLRLLPGVGPARAAAIVRERRRAPFSSLDDLRRVPGIGPVTLRRIREAREVRVVVGPPSDGRR